MKVIIQCLCGKHVPPQEVESDDIKLTPEFLEELAAFLEEKTPDAL